MQKKFNCFKIHIFKRAKHNTRLVDNGRYFPQTARIIQQVHTQDGTTEKKDTHKNCWWCDQKQSDTVKINDKTVIETQKDARKKNFRGQRFALCVGRKNETKNCSIDEAHNMGGAHAHAFITTELKMLCIFADARRSYLSKQRAHFPQRTVESGQWYSTRVGV